MSERKQAAVPARNDSERIHPTAIVEPGVQIGARTAIWDNVHIRGPAQIGHDCIIGEKTYIAYGVNIGNFVKINAQVYICTGVTIEDQVMISAGVIFTNDRYPRAFGKAGDLAPSEPTADTPATTVKEGATIGAGAVIGPGIKLGLFSMVGMGTVVTSDVAPHALVFGNPAQVRGYVCICGTKLLTSSQAESAPRTTVTCRHCFKSYHPQLKGDSELHFLRK